MVSNQSVLRLIGINLCNIASFFIMRIFNVGWHSDVNRGVSVFISIQLFQLTSKASIVKPCAL